ncbi:hypothetical protein NCCP1664_16320 [Zafaria cholistanensis]|uniref:GmrSD restriction endonucleases C-terminal domain-containing protein n=1 Tax=Zafaria cholistanensis TaxID=1682741 RepID=A0A5A7NRF2_9MICC|nr:HNH endonuclease family protein [Zafaria cholistanensis]GER23136.1 hypothetical protein NCCP1664_16320 [Zafaria cholistanensis]
MKKPFLSALVAAASLLVAGCGSAAATLEPATIASATSGTATPTPSSGELATEVLDTLAVKGKAPGTGFDRNRQFGNGWKDPDGNKCDARNDALARDLTAKTYKDGSTCQVAAGRLADPYTGTPVRFTVGAGAVDIDHVVALKNVWVSGGQKLTAGQRVAIANDPLNLLAVDSGTNRSKGDRNAAEWLPPNKAYRCNYVARQITVKDKYALAVTPAEKSAMAAVLAGCPGQRTVVSTATGATGTASRGTTADPALPLVSPGAYCSPSGAAGIGAANGLRYTCTTSSTDDRNRWRQ